MVENSNSANTFILFGKGEALASNRQEDQEVSMLALYLLQISMVSINTLMIQRVLSEPSWSGRLTTEDLRALTPLIYGHVNPSARRRPAAQRPIPPDTSMRWPLIQRLSSESSAAIMGPMSSGCPTWPSAVISATRLFTSGLSRTVMT